MQRVSTTYRKRGAWGSGRGSSFQQSWISSYGLLIVDRDPNTGLVTCLECRFCRCFGKDDDDESDFRRRRRRRSGIKKFTAPWRSDHIVNHLRDQHARLFALYCKLTDDSDKELFFSQGRGALGAKPQSPPVALLPETLPASPSSSSPSPLSTPPPQRYHQSMQVSQQQQQQQQQQQLVGNVDAEILEVIKRARRQGKSSVMYALSLSLPL